jgi:Cu2+-exporting ATPase
MSLHPLGYALAQSRGVDGDASEQIESFEAVAGQGIKGRVSGREIMVGRPDWITGLVGEPSDDLTGKLADIIQAGHSPIAIAVDGTIEAVAAFGDRIRDESEEIIAHLKQAGKEVYLLSGDHPEVVKRVAGQLNLAPEFALGNVGPEDKRDFVTRKVDIEGRTVVMVGDGVNDAVALQAADVGIAVQGGSTASLVAADVFLTKPGLSTVADLFRGARVVMRVIRRNLWISLAYNVLGAAAAIAGFVTPLVAAVAMPISSLVVVLSSILQRSFSPHKNTSRSSP